MKILDHYSFFSYRCRVHGVPFYVGLVAPFLIIYLFNWIVYIIILASLCRKNYQKQDEKRNNRVQIKQQLIAAAILSILFGLGWGIGLLATEGVGVEALRDFFSAVFIICTAFQGIMIFILQTLRSKQARTTWARWFHMATGRDSSHLTSSASISQAWRTRRSPKHSRFDSSAEQGDTLKNKISTLQWNVNNASFPPGIIVTGQRELDEKKPCTGEVICNYLTERTAEFERALTSNDYEEVDTSLVSKEPLTSNEYEVVDTSKETHIYEVVETSLTEPINNDYEMVECTLTFD